MLKRFLIYAVFALHCIHCINTEDINNIKSDDALHRKEVDISLEYKTESKLHASENSFNAEVCKCKNGKCVKKDGKLVCTCPPEYGVYDYAVKAECRACNCGKDSNCTMNVTFWATIINCICKDGYRVVNHFCQGPCTKNPCKNGGTCADVNKTFKCICPNGFSGKLCEAKSPCSSNPCQNGGTCTANGSSFKCSCPKPFFGSLCEKVNIDECNCMNGKCYMDSNGALQCACLPEFGKYSDSFCKECDCGKGANCTFDKGIFSDGKKCVCPYNFKEKKGRCEDACSSNPCENGGTCQAMGNTFKCICKEPYSGETCHNECICENGKCYRDFKGELQCACQPEFGKYSDHVCKECNCGKGANCTFDKGIFSDGKKCICPDNFKEQLGRCEDACSSNPCENGGTCQAMENTFKCICKEPYSGETCHNDPCSSSPCFNEGVCNVVGRDFKCTCKPGTRGRQCEFDPCSSKPCKNNGICYADLDNYSCYCKMPFFGRNCEEIYSTTELLKSTEYTALPDDCSCGINSLNCILSRGKKICKCKENYAQRNETCTETCRCNSDCLNGGLCNKERGNYFCKCPDVYLGDMCQIDLCEDINPSCYGSGGTCKRLGDIGVCQCPEGKVLSRSSRSCEDVCNYETCVHGYCRTFAGIYKCVCNDGFTGRHCNIKIKQSTDSTPLQIILLILSIGIVIFAAAAIITICWVKRLHEKLMKN